MLSTATEYVYDNQIIRDSK